MNPNMWSFDLPIYAWLAVAAAALAALIILIILIPRCRSIVKAQRRASESSPVLDTAEYPGVTVVIYARDDAATLPQLIRAVYSQDYPGEVEVVVVCDLSGYDTADVDAAGALQTEYPTLRVTYIPAHSRSLSRKKLAVTLGVKAARQPFVAMTCGNCVIPSYDWLRCMMTHAAYGSQVVVGLSTMRDADGEAGPRPVLRGFDSVWQSVRTIGSALGGHPHRATGNNLVYARDLFFANQGFASSLNLTYGDDDLFVNEIADGSNTAVELSDSSIVEARERNPVRAYRMERLHRDFTARYLPQTPYLVMGLMSCMWWMWLAASVVAVIAGLPSLVSACAVLILALALCIPVMVWWHRAAKVLKAPSAACVTAPLLMLWHPLYNMVYRLRGLRRRSENYTWGRQK